MNITRHKVLIEMYKISSNRNQTTTNEKPVRHPHPHPHPPKYTHTLPAMKAAITSSWMSCRSRPKKVLTGAGIAFFLSFFFRLTADARD